jgi:hypothetical protein
MLGRTRGTSVLSPDLETMTRSLGLHRKGARAGTRSKHNQAVLRKLWPGWSLSQVWFCRVLLALGKYCLRGVILFSYWKIACFLSQDVGLQGSVSGIWDNLKRLRENRTEKQSGVSQDSDQVPSGGAKDNFKGVSVILWLIDFVFSFIW